MPGSPATRYPDLYLLLLTLAAVLIVYLWSMPRTVVLEDDGFFILAAWFNGIAHPPGYPLFTTLGHFASQVPFFTPAMRVHFLSAVFGALSCVVLWLIIYQLIRDRFLATTGALTLSVSTIFWSQAIIAEVYTLNCFLFLTLLYFCLKLRDSGMMHLGKGSLLIVAFVFGLGLANHWPLFLLASPAFIPLLWPKRRQIIQAWPVLLSGLILGLLPYAWMVYRSQMQPEISFHGPIDDLKDFWFYLSRKPYTTTDISPSAGLEDKLRFILFHFRELVSQYGPFGWLFVMAGFVGQWRWKDKSLPVALILAYLGNSLVLILLLGFDYDRFHQAVFSVYPLTAYAIGVIWLCAGVYMIRELPCSGKLPTYLSRNLVYPAAVLVLATAFMANAADNYRARDTWAEDYARVLLFPLEQDSILFANGDPVLGPVSYLTMIKKVRTDIRLYNDKAVLLPDRLYDPISVKNLVLSETVNKFVLSADKPVYYTNYLPHGFGIEDFGLLKRMLVDKPDNFRRTTLVQTYLDYIEHILELPTLQDRWERMHRQLLLTNYCTFIVQSLNESNNNSEQMSILKNLKDRVCNTFQGMIEVIESERNKSKPDWMLVRQYIDRAWGLIDQSVVKAEHSRINFYEGEYYKNTGDPQRALEYYRRAYEIRPNPHGLPAARIKELE